jgi:6-phosphofructokinase 1
MPKIAVLTSGGDAPGMNAAIRAIVRTGMERGYEVEGVRRGYQGLIAGDFVHLSARDVGGVMHRGGTLLGSSRCPEFELEKAREDAIEGLRARDIEALVVIGGNGSQRGAAALSAIGYPVVGIASTIDNDLAGTDVTLGVDTALNVAVEAIDRLRVTAASHRRASILEVMGRDCGYLAMIAGLAGGAEAIVIPEIEMTADEVAQQIREAQERGKKHALVVVAEGASLDALTLRDALQPQHEALGFDLRVTVLGHVQRGGVPTVADRMLGTRFGNAATRCLAEGVQGVLIGEVDGGLHHTPYTELGTLDKPLDPELVELARVLAM